MRRPLGVTVIAILAIISGAFNLLGGISALLAYSRGILPATGGEPMTPAALLWLGLFSLALGVFLIVLGIAALRLQRWAWYGLLAVMALMAVQGILAIAQGNIFGGILSLAIAALIIYYLFTPEVQSAFGRQLPARATPAV